MARATATMSAFPRGAGRSWDPTIRSSGSSTRSFRLLDPALTTRMRIGSSGSVRPGPGPDLGRVLALHARVRPRHQAPVDHQLANVRGPWPQARHAVNHVHHEVEPVEVVEHDHVAVSYTHLRAHETGRNLVC